MFFARRQSLLPLAVLLIAAALSVAADRARSERSPASEQKPVVKPAASVARPPIPTPAEELMQDSSPDIADPAAATASVSAVRSVWMEVTAYCPCTKCCGPNAMGITASGLPVSHNEGRFVAADTSVLPFGSQIRVPGYHNAIPVPVIDRGGAIRGQRLDLFFPTHEEALQWGRQWVMVAVAE